jgi:hypothetical protein
MTIERQFARVDQNRAPHNVEKLDQVRLLGVMAQTLVTVEYVVYAISLAHQRISQYLGQQTKSLNDSSIQT